MYDNFIQQRYFVFCLPDNVFICIIILKFFVVDNIEGNNFYQIKISK